MAVPAGTLSAHTAIGNREDLADAIYNVSPTQTPFLSMAARSKATAVVHEWQTDAYAAAATANAQIEGDDAANGTSTPTNRIKNYCQISSKFALVSGTQLAVRTAGRKSEMAYQLQKRTIELKRDMEAILTGNHSSSVGGVGTARQLAGLESWLSTNKTSAGTGTAQTTPGYATATGLVAAPTDSTVAAAITVTQLKAVIRSVFNSGGNPGVIMAGPFNKQAISAFAGIATLYREAGNTSKSTAIIGAADLYVSDYGELRVVPNRFQRDQTVFVLDMDMWAVAYLRSFNVEEIARTGDAEKKQLVVEYTLEARNEASSGKITDCSTS